MLLGCLNENCVFYFYFFDQLHLESVESYFSYFICEMQAK